MHCKYDEAKDLEEHTPCVPPLKSGVFALLQDARKRVGPPNRRAGIPKKYRVPLLFICGTILFTCSKFQCIAIPGAVFNELQMKWGLTPSQVTGFGASFMYVYAVAQLFAGLFCDRYGGIRVIALGGIFFTLGSFLFSLSDNYILLCTGRGLVGLGASTFYLGLVAEAIRCFKRNYAVVISGVIVTGYFGGIMANAPFAFAVTRSSLRSVLTCASVLTLAFYLAFLLLSGAVRKPPVRDVPFSCRTFVNVMKNRRNWNLFLFFSVHWGLFYSIQTVIGKKYLEDFCGISADAAAAVLSATSVLSAVSGFAYVMGSRRLSNRRKPFCLLTAIVTFSVFLLLAVLTALDIRCFTPAVLYCFLASVASLSAIVVPLIKESNAPGETGSAVAFSSFLAYIFVAVFGNVIGGILDLFSPENAGGKLIYSRGAYLTVFGFLLVCSAAVLCWAARIKEAAPRLRGDGRSADANTA
ncbi:MAG: MFS transporter [Lentisphaeria bacterium]|nr:MFS transporter [Lentisphaeria bacterium]